MQQLKAIVHKSYTVCIDESRHFYLIFCNLRCCEIWFTKFIDYGYFCTDINIRHRYKYTPVSDWCCKIWSTKFYWLGRLLYRYASEWLMSIGTEERDNEWFSGALFTSRVCQLVGAFSVSSVGLSQDDTHKTSNYAAIAYSRALWRNHHEQTRHTNHAGSAGWNGKQYNDCQAAMLLGLYCWGDGLNQTMPVQQEYHKVHNSTSNARLVTQHSLLSCPLTESVWRVHKYIWEPAETSTVSFATVLCKKMNPDKTIGLVEWDTSRIAAI